MNKKISNIRALAIFLVVLGHSIILYTGWNIMSTHRSIPNIQYVKRFINLMEMPLFMSVGGYVFYYSMKRKPKFISFLQGKIKRIIIPYFCVGAFWVAPTRMLLKIKGFKKGYFQNVWDNIVLCKSNGHLWYLIALFFIFVVIYYVVAANDKGADGSKVYDLIVLGVLLFISMSSKDGYILDFSNNSVTRTFYYLFWFYFGYVLNKYLSDEIEKEHNWRNGLTSLTFFVVLFVLYNIYKNNYLYYATAFMGVISTYLLVPAIDNKFLNGLSKNSYGIYLFHSPMVYITFTYLKEKNPYMVVLINVVILSAIAILITEILRISPFAFIVGEKRRAKKSMDCHGKKD